MTLQINSTLQSGRYRILSILGQGGFGITYLAEQTMLGRKVAIKEFFMKGLCDRDESTSHVTLGTAASRDTVIRFREKFLKEARNNAKLNHSNIVRIFDVFEENGTAYYVMDYIGGKSLSGKVKSEGPLTEETATRYILQVADALEYIHSHKMNHLDVKPANVVLNDETGAAVLIDFGLSKQYDSTGEQTSTTPVGISDGYAPMEQYKTGGVGSFSPQTDIYSLGATFYYLLTGLVPPSASDVNEDGVPVEKLKAKGVSPKAIDVICQAMKSSRKNRLPNVKAFKERLKVSVPPTKDEDDEDTLFVKPIVTEPQPLPVPPVEPQPKPQQEPYPEPTPKTFPTLKIVLGIAAAILISALVLFLKKESRPEPPRQVVKEAIYDDNGRFTYYWTGIIKDDHPLGLGTINYPKNDPDGRDEYKGAVTNGKRDCTDATLTYRNGNRYKGSFVNDHFEKGKLILVNDGIYFEGTFKDDQPYNGSWCFVTDNSLYSNVVDGEEK